MGEYGKAIAILSGELRALQTRRLPVQPPVPRRLSLRLLVNNRTNHLTHILICRWNSPRWWKLNQLIQSSISHQDRTTGRHWCQNHLLTLTRTDLQLCGLQMTMSKVMRATDDRLQQLHPNVTKGQEIVSVHHRQQQRQPVLPLNYNVHLTF